MRNLKTWNFPFPAACHTVPGCLRGRRLRPLIVTQLETPVQSEGDLRQHE